MPSSHMEFFVKDGSGTAKASSAARVKGACKEMVGELRRVFDSSQMQRVDGIARLQINFAPPSKASPPPSPKPSPVGSKSRRVRLEDYEIGRLIGAGTFGRVYVARHKLTGVPVALKSMSKAAVLKDGQLKHVSDERDMLAVVEHPFLIHLQGTAQDARFIFLALDFIQGGEFFTHLRDHGRLQENDARFYSAQLVLAIEYLHSKNIAYRDLKPENMLIAADGYVKVTDFGFAKIIAQRSSTMCGTPDYLAPELIMNQPHTKAVDWWALGCVIYEMLYGYPPFYTGDPVKTYAKVLAGKFEFSSPTNFSSAVQDIIKRLLTADVSRRLGSSPGGVQELREHPWFRGIDWKLVSGKNYAPSYLPPVKAPDDTSNFDDYSKTPEIHHAWDLSMEQQSLFAGF